MYLSSYKWLANWLTFIREWLRFLPNSIDRNITPRSCGRLKRWRQARNVPPVIQITSKLADNCTRITARLAQRHRQEQQQQQEYRAGAIKRRQARDVPPIIQITTTYANRRIPTTTTARQPHERMLATVRAIMPGGC